MNPVLVALDPTGSTDEAEQLGLVLARAIRADVVLATVFPVINLRSYVHSRGLSVPGPMGTRFAHGAPCPVAVAPANAAIRALTRIGAAFAETDDGRHALRVAASLAERAGAALRVIAVAAPLPWMDLTDPEFDGTTLQEFYKGHVAYFLENAVADLPASLAVESDVLSGDPVEILAAASEDLDLVVCGSRGHGPVGEVAVGSISHALLEAVRCPMLIVPRLSGHARDDQSRCFAA